MTGLPIEDVIAPLIARLGAQGVAVLQAPPGAGKTTRVPLALLEAGAFDGKLVMLEPRRLAARAAAERMADQLSETAGQTVGYRMRGETRVSPQTRIEVVTEGVLTRMIQSDPALDGIGAVVFDEFHERSLNGDLGLALVTEAREALRPDLKLLVMSATLDAEPVAEMLQAPTITSDGRAFPVETRWLDRPLRRDGRPFERARRFTRATCDLIEQAVADEEGGILVFLPGAREIRAVEQALTLTGIDVMPLYGALPFAEQRAAILPRKTRKVVLATSVAETSLTIEDVRIVIDTGRARRARFDPGSGMSRLVTEPVSRAEADQRRGRAGRTQPGICLRMWAKAEQGALPAFPPAEITTADLSSLALELAAWGTGPNDLSFLTPPPDGAYATAQELLETLGALTDGRITDHGRAIAKLPLHPRLAHMLIRTGSDGATLAAFLSGRSTSEGHGADLAPRLKTISKEMRRDATRLSKLVPDRGRLSIGEQAALAYPDRIGLRRKGEAPRYVLSDGKGAALPDGDALSGARLIVALNLDGDAREAKTRQALQITESELRGLYGDQIAWQNTCAWDPRTRKVVATQREMFGAVTLTERNWKEAPEEAITAGLVEGVKQLGLEALNWSKAAVLLRARVMVCKGMDGLPDWSDEALLADLDTWLAPFASGMRQASDLKSIDIANALRAHLPWDASQIIDRTAPAAFTSPLGRKIAIDYSAEVPAISVRLQELFGVTTHPTVAGQPLRITLLSPGQKPVQVTMDLPGFWTSSYADVRKDMRGRYPRHPWPEDPSIADPTMRAKPRGT